MFKLCLFVCFLMVASATSTGYNYRSSTTQITNHAQLIQQNRQTQTTNYGNGVTKHFYYFSAPEEPVEHRTIVRKIVVGPQKVKKNVQVIFIKTPEENHHKKHLIQNTAVEDKTHIYVLNQEPNHVSSTRKVQHVQQATVHYHKPEVHFVKYNTPAEAQRIQESIIQQYGGKPSEIVQSGSAPVVNFINTNQHHTNDESVNRQYLAPPEPSSNLAPPEPSSTLAPPETSSNLVVDKNYAKNFLPSGIDVVPGSSYLPPALRF